ncbi:UNVERIFIED_CONTAM: hypothetical protein RMT77_001614 [Armadillidium vulgare]
MSPLIDVTNIVKKVDTNQNESFCESHGCHYSSNNKNDADKNSNLTYSNNEEECKNNQSISKNNETSSDINKISYVPINCKCNGAKPKIINKTGRRKSKKSHSEIQDSKESFSIEIKNDRVPPIEYDDNFFHSLERLSLNSVNEKKSIAGVVHENEYKSQTKSCCDGFPSKKKSTSENFSSTYQCIACGLELSSLEILTNHLVKHIYEGLHAASWLNHAMSILLPENDTTVNSLPTQNLQTQNVLTDQISSSDIQEKSTEHSTVIPKVEA